MIIRYPSTDPVCRLREEAIAVQVDIFRHAEVDADENHENDRLHALFWTAWRQLPWWARIGVWQTAMHRYDRGVADPPGGR